MKVVIQRVKEASVTVNEAVCGRIAQGLVILVGIASTDSEEKLKSMAEKIINLRIFPDDNGKLNYSLLDMESAVLLIPQFTLFADCSKGRRPNFDAAMKQPMAEDLFKQFVDYFREFGVSQVQTGIFGADMEVTLVNFGPLTIGLEN